MTRMFLPLCSSFGCEISKNPSYQIRCTIRRSSARKMPEGPVPSSRIYLQRTAGSFYI